MNHRFTIDGSADLERQLQRVCDLFLEGVTRIIPGRDLVGLALAGGYGRGEGGVLRLPGGDCPYNDLEFFILVSGSTLLTERRYSGAVVQLAAQLSQVAGIDVEFKILSQAKLRQSTINMFYYDLVSRHRRLAGEDNLFADCEHHLVAANIPMHEATRLLFNRCSGLLFSKWRLRAEEWTDADADFVGRNIAKAKLALGDVWLTMRGSYNWSCLERNNLLGAMADGWARRLLPLHNDGVEFKLRPFSHRAGDREALRSEFEEITAVAAELWLDLESARLNVPFQSPVEYAGSAKTLCPERLPAHNFLSNLRAFGRRGLWGRYALRYPRERLLRALSVLLWGTGTIREIRLLSECLLCDGDDQQAVATAYETLWHRFN